MSNINIENLSYDMNMDREAMDAISGSGWGWKWVKKKYKSVRRAGRKLRLKVERFMHRNGLYFKVSHSGKY